MWEGNKSCNWQNVCRNNGSVLWFCSSKCEKNSTKLKRDARKFKWTKFYEKGEAPQAAGTVKKEKPVVKKEAKVEAKKEEKKPVAKKVVSKKE